MTQYQAGQYCRNHGSRLPSAKELALVMNPSGVRKTPGAGFIPIRHQFGDVAFYYNYRTYSAYQIAGTPAVDGLSLQEFEYRFFWISSDDGYALGFYGYDGDIHFFGDHRRHYHLYSATRCIDL